MKIVSNRTNPQAFEVAASKQSPVYSYKRKLFTVHTPTHTKDKKEEEERYS